MRFALLAVLLLGLLAGEPLQASGCERIVSLAPSITETLFALTLGERVVGVTRYCRFPKAAASLPKVGGFLDPNYEAILRLAPTVVVGLKEQGDVLDILQAQGVATLTIDHRSIDGILDSLATIGEYCAAAARAYELRQQLQEGIFKVRSVSRAEPQRRVLLAVGRTTPDSLTTVFISGRDGYYNQLLDLANAKNVYNGPTTGVLAFSPEAFLLLRPDLILEIVPRLAENHWQRAALRQSWQELPLIGESARLKVKFVEGSYAEVPGPRFLQLLHEIVRALHE